MGAKQRAQARSKTTNSPKGSSKGSPWSQKKSSSSLAVPSLDPNIRHRALQGWSDFASSGSSPSSFQNGFSMAQEARNTDRHNLGWGASRLRHNAVSFVSAGTLTRDEPESSSGAKQENSDEIEAREKEPDSIPQPDFSTSQEPIVLEEPQPAEESVKSMLDEPPRVDVSMMQPALEQDNKADSESSSDAEEILFHGRGKPALVPAPNPVKKTTAATNGHLPDSTISAPPLSQPLSISLRSQQLQQRPLASSAEGPSGTTSKRNRANRLGKRRQNRKPQVSDEEEAILQDYIANMAVEDEDDEDDDEEVDTNKPRRRNETLRFYDGAADEHVKVQTKSKSAGQSSHDIDDAADWDSADLDDFDDLATTDEEIADIDQVLRHRQRPSGTQYLVTAVGKGASHAKWVLNSKLTSSIAVEEIQTYHQILAMKIEVEEDDSDSSPGDDDEALDDLINDLESENDENEKIMRQTAKMSDEQIARALAKQEELGIGGDELVLFDGQGDEADDTDQNAFARGHGFIPFSVSQHTSNRTRSKRHRRQRDSFPSAEALADAVEQDPYGGFDVMDFDRPSVRPKRKGKKGDFDFDLSDEDLAQHIKSTWMKDRDKKAERKREKMEALQDQLLESAERSHPAAIKLEIRRFLIEETDTLVLAPMESHIRASVHRLAKSLKLTSRSEGKEGKGLGRYPVLTKTEHTPYYNIDNVWEIDALMEQKKFFPKPGYHKLKAVKSAKASYKGRGGGSGGGNVADATLKSGDVVGSWAPELSADNKGRLLLEKMGWKAGMGIGAVGNEGGLEHVKQVVKRNKAGLG